MKVTLVAAFLTAFAAVASAVPAGIRLGAVQQEALKDFIKDLPQEADSYFVREANIIRSYSADGKLLGEKTVDPKEVMDAERKAIHLRRTTPVESANIFARARFCHEYACDQNEDCYQYYGDNGRGTVTRCAGCDENQQRCRRFDLDDKGP